MIWICSKGHGFFSGSRFEEHLIGGFSVILLTNQTENMVHLCFTPPQFRIVRAQKATTGNAEVFKNLRPAAWPNILVVSAFARLVQNMSSVNRLRQPGEFVDVRRLDWRQR